MAEKDEGGKLGWFLAGAVLGSAVALLYAPKSGKETREFINKKTGEGKEVLSETSRSPTMRRIFLSAAAGSCAAEAARRIRT
jgi:gas vesicle protein